MRQLCILQFCILLAANAVTVQAEGTGASEHAQEAPYGLGRAPREEAQKGLFLRLTRQAVLLNINARIIERDRVVSWNESHEKVTIPGHPVEIKLVGTNLVVAVQFTPYLRRGSGRKFLVAQGQIWMETPNQGISYHASIQTIPVQFGEPIYFFPLGPAREGTSSIEVMLTMYPYEAEEEN